MVETFAKDDKGWGVIFVETLVHQILRSHLDFQKRLRDTRQKVQMVAAAQKAGAVAVFFISFGLVGSGIPWGLSRSA